MKLRNFDSLTIDTEVETLVKASLPRIPDLKWNTINEIVNAAERADYLKPDFIKTLSNAAEYRRSIMRV